MSASDLRRFTRTARGAGAVAGIVFALAAAWWVETGASVGWASFNSEGEDIDPSTKLMLVAVAASAAAAVGLLVGQAVGMTAALCAVPLPDDPCLQRLVIRLTATGAVAAIPLIEVVADDLGGHSYTPKIPGWSLTTAGVATAVWLTVWLATRRRCAHPQPTTGVTPIDLHRA